MSIRSVVVLASVAACIAACASSADPDPAPTPQPDTTGVQPLGCPHWEDTGSSYPVYGTCLTACKTLCKPHTSYACRTTTPQTLPVYTCWCNDCS